MRYFDLSHFAVLRISGKDARQFLHGQVTCDLGQLDNHGWMHGAWCMPNGRVISTFITYRDQENYFLITPAMLKDKIIKRISMFILRAEVTITDESDGTALLGLAGNDAPAAIENIIGKPAFNNLSGLLQHDSVYVLGMKDQLPRYMVCCSMDKVTEVMDKLPADCEEGQRGQWSLLDIEAGIPWIINTTTELFLPQMLNLDELNGLSFTKGCYPGQEIIARVHYRGQLKRKMYLGKGRTAILPGPGDRIIDRGSDVPVGDIIDAEFGPDEELRFLAVVEIVHADSEGLCIKGNEKTPVTLTALPYQIS